MLKLTDAPIVIISKDRVRYLDLTLRSLSATVPATSRVYISNDGTRNPDMLRYLTSRETIALSANCRLMKGLPDEKQVSGIAGKVNILLYERSAGTRNLGSSMKYVFEQTDAPFVIKMEDDIVFKKGWYLSLLGAMEGFDVVSGFRFFYGRVRFGESTEKVVELRNGYTGGPLMMVSRRYYEGCRRVFNNEIDTIWDNDDLWIQQCRRNHMRFGVVKVGLCQHIGHSSESMQDTKMRIDPDFGEFELAEDVKIFATDKRLIRIPPGKFFV